MAGLDLVFPVNYQTHVKSNQNWKVPCALHCTAPSRALLLRILLGLKTAQDDIVQQRFLDCYRGGSMASPPV